MSTTVDTEDENEVPCKRFKASHEDDADNIKRKEIIQEIKATCKHYNSLYYQWYPVKCVTAPQQSSTDEIKISAVINGDMSSSKCETPCDSETVAKSEDTLKPSTNDENYSDACVHSDCSPNLLSLSDDVLLLILQNLHPFDVLNVSRTCTRLADICHDRALWTDIDFRHNIDDKMYMKRPIDFSDFIEFILPQTRSLKKSGSTKVDYAEYACTTSKTTQVSITADFINAVSEKAKNLKSVALESHILYGQSLTLDCFPSSLEHLSLKNSIVVRFRGDRSYFFQVHQILPNLRVLDLTGCQWFHAQSFLALSKSATLKELYVKGCLGVADCVPYASLASHFGFPSLEKAVNKGPLSKLLVIFTTSRIECILSNGVVWLVLDLRLTHVTDSDVSCFTRVKSLKKLYLEALRSEKDSKITDIGIASFGKERGAPDENQSDESYVLILRNHVPYHRPESLLETLVVSHYRSITDISLKHAASCLPHLKYLDVRGTSCTEKGTQMFKTLRPDVELLSDFNSNNIEEITL